MAGEEARTCTCSHLAIAHYYDGETDRCSHCHCHDYEDADPVQRRKRGDGFRFRFDDDTPLIPNTREQIKRAVGLGIKVAEDDAQAREFALMLTQPEWWSK